MDTINQQLTDLATQFIAKAAELGADTSQVLLTRVDHLGTHAVVEGAGNVYARRGLCEEWLRQQDEIDRHWVRKAKDSE